MSEEPVPRWLARPPSAPGTIRWAFAPLLLLAIISGYELTGIVIWLFGTDWPTALLSLVFVPTFAGLAVRSMRGSWPLMLGLLAVHTLVGTGAFLLAQVVLFPPPWLSLGGLGLTAAAGALLWTPSAQWYFDATLAYRERRPPAMRPHRES
ncbi:hypothetical protein JOF53_005132 [Crossiella equi]|uniref:Uncharacterized protein n=1 Tax=Crossiella equi TaxID=130796 RepID=A0ABS5AKS4_9PSEU|nr:hypothetical protein [Crossiella equi]MBP2476260.1 hypothetical protein [Crossiella equi]